MILIKEISHPDTKEGFTVVPLKADRHTLAKKRWRGYAANGQEFGFELSEPILTGTPFHLEGSELYIVEQKPETLLAIRLPSGTDEAAELGWRLGNLHMPLQVTSTHAILADDPGMRLNLERQHLEFDVIEGIFRPLRNKAHSHDHGHEHHHHGDGCCGHDH